MILSLEPLETQIRSPEKEFELWIHAIAFSSLYIFYFIAAKEEQVVISAVKGKGGIKRRKIGYQIRWTFMIAARNKRVSKYFFSFRNI